MNVCAHCTRPGEERCYACSAFVCYQHAWYVVKSEHGTTQAVKCLACRYGWSKR